MDDKVAFAFVALIEILLGIDFKDIVTHLETNWLNLRRYLFTWLLDVTESLIGFAVKLWKSGRPLLSDFLENVRRN